MWLFPIKPIKAAVSHFHIQIFINTKRKACLFCFSSTCILTIQLERGTYIWPVSKSSIERLFTGSKQILDIIQTFDFELLRLLFYHFPKIKFQQSNSKSLFDRKYFPFPIYLVFIFSLLPVASTGSYIDSVK